MVEVVDVVAVTALVVIFLLSLGRVAVVVAAAGLFPLLAAHATHIGVNFYKAAIGSSPIPHFLKSKSFQPSSPPLFVRCKFCSAYYKAV